MPEKIKNIAELNAIMAFKPWEIKESDIV